MSNQISCRITGFGGQGVMLAGVVLGLAAILDEKFAAQTQSYGPEARGGAARSDLIISNEEIDSLLVTKPNIIVALSQEGYDKYAKGKDYNYAFIDSSIVDAEKTEKTFLVPFTKLAVEKLDLKQTANMLMLGIVNGVTKLVTDASLREAIRQSVPEKTIESNLRAINLGLAMALALVKH